MSTSPFVTALRSLNYSHVVENFSGDLVNAYDTMKLPRIEKRIKAMNNSFDNQVKVAKVTNEFAASNSIKELTEKIKEIRDFSAVRYSGRVFKPDIIKKSEPLIDLSEPVKSQQENAN